MTATEETTTATVVQRQWALRKKASERQHFKVVEGKFESYSVKAPPALDVVMAEAAFNKPGAKMTDGSIFAGFTADGKQKIYATPSDLDMTMNFNDAAKAVGKLNAGKTLGHDDWQMPSLGTLRVLKNNYNGGKLKGTFITANKSSGIDCPDWYWSSTPYRDSPTFVDIFRFSDSNVSWDYKDYFRMSCRPVRLVPV